MDTSSDCEMLLHLLRENSHWRWKSPLCSGLAEGMHHLIPTSPSLWRLSWDLNGASSLQRGKFLPEWMMPSWGLQDVALSAAPALKEFGGFHTVDLKTSTNGSAYPPRGCVLIPAFGSICFSCKCSGVMVVIEALTHPRNQTSLGAYGYLRVHTSYGLVAPLLIPQGTEYQKPQILKAPKLFTAVISETDADLLGQSVCVLPNQNLGVSLSHSTVTWSIVYCEWSF